jgi:hypothetical protein
VEETGVDGGAAALDRQRGPRAEPQAHLRLRRPRPEDAAPRSDQKEVDEAKFVPIDRARFLLHPRR